MAHSESDSDEEEGEAEQSEEEMDDSQDANSTRKAKQANSASKKEDKRAERLRLRRLNQRQNNGLKLERKLSVTSSAGRGILASNNMVMDDNGHIEEHSQQSATKQSMAHPNKVTGDEQQMQQTVQNATE